MTASALTLYKQAAGGGRLSGLLSVLRSMGRPLAREVIRPAATTAAGTAAGYYGGQLADQHFGYTNNELSRLGAMLGGGAGLTTGSPLVRGQLRYAARVPPGAAYRPVRDTLNLFFRPRYPIVEPAVTSAFPRAGAAVFGAARAAPLVSTGIGTGLFVANATQQLPSEIYSAAASEDGLFLPNDVAGNTHPAAQAIYDNVNRAQPEILRDIFHRDTTPVGPALREFVRRSALPTTRYGVYQAQLDNPLATQLIRMLRYTSPYGWATTAAVDAATTPTPPEFNAIAADVWRQHGRQLLARESLRSPTARRVLDAVLPSQLVNDSFVHLNLGERLAPRDITSALPPAAQTWLGRVQQWLNTDGALPIRRALQRGDGETATPASIVGTLATQPRYPRNVMTPQFVTESRTVPTTDLRVDVPQGVQAATDLASGRLALRAADWLRQRVGPSALPDPATAAVGAGAIGGAGLGIMLNTMLGRRKKLLPAGVLGGLLGAAAGGAYSAATRR